ncbi:hypothetical protein SRB5_38710 [Streptomyces sp. RB5]|uniref:MoxR-vWA-beta-propeller ternary system domain-containing protein n=1 Tax=Streptomyces smaragdinus TaxID=2585196 RepID=A0A7K0CJQ3_9ACTN|nr:hypothetical protein [Streptomyces smaragdinus]MQY13720.1 hypothetical protein [Streptomyces smaragdinus]
MTPVRFVPREPPLTPTAVAARGPAAEALRAAARTTLRVAQADGWLLLLSRDPRGADLPWADGVHWLAPDQGLYLPTHLTTDPPPALVARAAARRAPRGHTLLALLPGHLLAVTAR